MVQRHQFLQYCRDWCRVLRRVGSKLAKNLHGIAGNTVSHSVQHPWNLLCPDVNVVACQIVVQAAQEVHDCGVLADTT